MHRERRLARYPLVLDRDSIQMTLITLNTDTLALHYPGRDGLCPLCREPLCETRLAAVRALRAQGVKVPVLPPHVPSRPGWECELCDCPWPCSQARVMLGDEYETDRAGLAARMAEYQRQAAAELPHATPGELHTRFVGWVVRW